MGIGLLTVSVGLCVAAQWHQRREVKVLLSMLEEAETVFLAEDIPGAQALVAEFCTEYERRTALFPCFMSHDDLNGLRECIAVLPATLAGESTEEFLLEAARCRGLLERLRQVERPDWQNIF